MPPAPPEDGQQAGGRRRVALVTLGCARNEVDSDELAGRLVASGWSLVDEPARADAVVVNTCGFIDAAKKDSVDTLLAAADLKDGHRPRAVVAVGCLAERYGTELAASLPEADAVVGFDGYEDISAHLTATLEGRPPSAHTPRDRRALLPVTPVQRSTSTLAIPGHAGPDLPDADGPWPVSGPRPVRQRLKGGPVASLKLASGCDRRCAFCAIPSFRGAFVSRRPEDVLAEAEWLARDGVRELVLVSENSTSYGKDLGDLRALEALLPRLAAVPGIARVRVAYLQPAELRPTLIDVLASTPGVAPYFDLSFQHASGPLLRRMRRFGDADHFLELLARIRELVPAAGVRSNVIVGFPGETRADVAVLGAFLERARLDAVGVFAYSDEEGTEAAGLDGKVSPVTVSRRLQRIAGLAEALTTQRAEERVGEVVEVLVEEVSGGVAHGRAAHQAPEVDGTCTVRLGDQRGTVAVGDLVIARVRAAHGVDLAADLLAGVQATAPSDLPGAAAPGPLRAAR